MRVVGTIAPSTIAGAAGANVVGAIRSVERVKTDLGVSWRAIGGFQADVYDHKGVVVDQIAAGSVFVPGKGGELLRELAEAAWGTPSPETIIVRDRPQDSLVYAQRRPEDPESIELVTSWSQVPDEDAPQGFVWSIDFPTIDPSSTPHGQVLARLKAPAPPPQLKSGKS